MATLAVLAIIASACSGTSRNESELTVFGTWRGDQATAFRAVLDDFEDETGITVRYTGSSSFIVSIRERSEEGDVPDVAMFPQPGLLQDLADEGLVLPLRGDISSLAAANLLPAVADVARTSRGLDGVPVTVNVKSLVWYSPNVFAEQGWQVPQTWTELAALTTTIGSAGFRPWCLGIAAGDATGWPATDWVEDIVLRQLGTDVYDDWVDGIIPFTDDRIGAAITEFGDLTFSGGTAAEGRRTIVNTTPARAMDPIFADPPGCAMYKQASFQADDLPPGTEIGPEGDVNVFVLPGDDGADPPLLIGGNVAAAMTNREATWSLLAFLARPESGRAWAEAGDGSFISPYEGFDPSWYVSDFDRSMAAILGDADIVRFDGSDSMYAPVGTDSFFDAMTVYVASSRLQLTQETAQAGYER